MKRATTFMVEKVSTKGGYLWSYLPDFSRRWGEMEAYPSMIWIQSPGTVSMGHLFLDAYHATHDEYYYTAALQVADALIAGQHPSGGWNYVIDFAGEASLKKWYDTVGRNGWRLEEFQHYYGNATFDDSTSSEAAKFLLRVFVEKHDPKYRPALDRAIGFVLASQHATGAWPQRFPPAGEFSKDGLPDYTSFLTFNDAVTDANIDFLILCYQVLGDEKLLAPIHRGMDVYITAQQPAPQPGWALQYTPDLKPAGARSYEPKAIVTHTTGNAIDQLLQYYDLTGDAKFLAPIPSALAWLDSVKLPPELQLGRGGASMPYPTFIEVGTGKPLYVHRRGSNVVNGHYYVDNDPHNTIAHYSSFRGVNVAELRARYEKAKATPSAEAIKDSPLRPGAGRTPLPKYFTMRAGGFFAENGGPTDAAARVIGDLNAEGYWPALLRSTSHPYTHDGAKEVTPGDFSRTQVGDDTDTSPYNNPDRVMGITTSAYIRNMNTLIRFVDSTKP